MVQSFVRYIVDLLDDFGIDTTVCEDVYLALAAITKKISQKVVVFGRFEQLSVEEGRFFQIITEKGFFCCCLNSDDSPEKAEDFLTKLLADNFASLPEPKNNTNTSAFKKADFNLTRAELDALLEV